MTVGQTSTTSLGVDAHHDFEGALLDSKKAQMKLDHAVRRIRRIRLDRAISLGVL